MKKTQNKSINGGSTNVLNLKAKMTFKNTFKSLSYECLFPCYLYNYPKTWVYWISTGNKQSTTETTANI